MILILFEGMILSNLSMNFRSFAFDLLQTLNNVGGIIYVIG